MSASIPAAHPAADLDDVTKIPLGVSQRDGQTRFGVWAPHATSVSVAGDWCDWDYDACPMTREGDNWFAAANVPEGSAYKYRIKSEFGVFERIDPRAREVSNSVGHGLVSFPHAKPSEFQAPNLCDLVIYELHIGTFGGGAGNGVGTFDDAIGRLPHLQALGVNAVELMPTAEFAGDLSWGYNPAHPFAVESAYGGPDGLRRLVQSCHEVGIAVLLDVVFNHFGPSDLDLWRFDGWGEGDFGGIYFFNDERSETPWGNTRPDYGRREVRDYIRDNAECWIREYGVDGLRFDMTLYMRSIDAMGQRPIPEGWSLTQEVNDAILRLQGELGRPLLTIAEDLQDEPSLTRPTSEDGAGFTTQWSAEFVHPIREMLISPNDADRLPSRLAPILEFRYSDDAFERVVYTESHDEVANGQARLPTEINPGDSAGEYAARRAGLGLMLMMTTPGVPMLFQGQEFLRDQWFQDSRAIDWSQATANKGFVQLASDLIRLRTGRTGDAVGLRGQHVAVLHKNDETGVIAWHRWEAGGPGDDVIVVANLRNEVRADYRVGLPLAGRFELVFNGGAADYGPQFDGVAGFDVQSEAIGCDGHPDSIAVTVDRYSVMIYVRR